MTLLLIALIVFFKFHCFLTQPMVINSSKIMLALERNGPNFPYAYTQGKLDIRISDRIVIWIARVKLDNAWSAHKKAEFCEI